MSLSVQTMMQPSAKNGTLLEKVADAFMLLPCGLWQNRVIKIKTEINQLKIDDPEKISFYKLFHPGKSDFLQCCIGTYPFSLAVAIPVLGAFIISSMLAAPLLGIGIACKKIALNNPKVRSYYIAVEETSNELKLKRKINKLEIQSNSLKVKLEGAKAKLQALSAIVELNEMDKPNNEAKLAKLTAKIKSLESSKMTIDEKSAALGVRWEYTHASALDALNKVRKIYPL